MGYLCETSMSFFHKGLNKDKTHMVHEINEPTVEVLSFAACSEWVRS